KRSRFYSGRRIGGLPILVMNRSAAPARNIQELSGGRPGIYVARRYLHRRSPRPLVETCLHTPALPDRMLRELFDFHSGGNKRLRSPKSTRLNSSHTV